MNPVALLLVICGLLSFALQEVRVQKAKAETERAKVELAQARERWAEDTALAIQDAIITERLQAERLAVIETQHQKELEAAHAAKDRVIAELRTGSLQLRDHWRGCETRLLSQAAASAAEPQDADQRRTDGAGDLVRLGQQCDARIRSLIEAYEAIR